MPEMFARFGPEDDVERWADEVVRTWQNGLPKDEYAALLELQG